MTISRMPSETGARRVERVRELEVGREPPAQLLHLLADALGDVERVRAGRLEDGDRAARLAVDAADLLVVERAELDPGDVAAGGSTEPSGFERTTMLPNSSLGLEPPLRADGVGHLLARRAPGSAPTCPDGLTVLCCWIGADEIGDGEAEPRERDPA